MNKNIAYEKDKSLPFRRSSQKKRKQDLYESFEKWRSFNWDKVCGTIVIFIVTRSVLVT